MLATPASPWHHRLRPFRSYLPGDTASIYNTFYEAQLIQLQTQLKGSKADAQKAAVKVGALDMELHEARKTIDAVEANCADTLRTERGLTSKLNEANERARRATNALSVQRNEHKRAIAALKARQEDEMARLRRKFEKCIADQAQQQLKKEEL